ncbi:protein kinase domain-containing protein [Streptomyces sp. DW26H14]|uniref:protein kinase domain-containing protein n=1 Tax=Streptomyces sp. DW26H14 TaxID=3435395 RepID=UPI00403D621F
MDKLAPGDSRSIGPYRLLARLGSGGLGQTFLGRSGEGRTVAVRLIRRELADQAPFRESLRQEVEAARRVAGSWIVPVVDADTESDAPWVASEYIAGPTLLALVSGGGPASGGPATGGGDGRAGAGEGTDGGGTRPGPLPPRSVRVLASGLAHALREIHTAGVVHRDLKPSNILITEQGPRVTDFGISRALDAATDGGLRLTGARTGAPGFMSPEQLRGETSTPASDVFSLGSVLTYATTGRLPFGSTDSSAHSLQLRITQEEPDTSGLPEALALLVRECLRKNAAERPSTTVILSRVGEPETAGGSWLPGGVLAEMGQHTVRLAPAKPTGPTGPAAGTAAGPAAGPGSPAAGTADPGPSTQRLRPIPATDPQQAPQAPLSQPQPQPQPQPQAQPPQGPQNPQGQQQQQGQSWPPLGPQAGPAAQPAAPGPRQPSYGYPQQQPPAVPQPPAQPQPQPQPGYGYPPQQHYQLPPPYQQQLQHQGQHQQPQPQPQSQSQSQPQPQPQPQPQSQPQPQPQPGPQPGYGYPPGSGTGTVLPPQPPGPGQALFATGPGSGRDDAAPSGRSKRGTIALIAVALIVAIGAGGAVYAVMGSGPDDDKAGSGTAAHSHGAPLPQGGDGSSAGAAPSGAPSTSASPSSSPSAKGDVPQEFLGTWSGGVRTKDGVSPRTLVISQGKAGDQVLVLTADGAPGGKGGYHCEFTAPLVSAPSAKGGPLKIGPSSVKVAQPTTSCAPGAATTLTIQPDGDLRRATPTGAAVTYKRE